MGELAEWAQKHSPFLKIPDDGEVEVCYLGFKEVDDTRNPGQTKMRFEVELNGDKKWFESASGRIAMSFDSYTPGDIIIIRKDIVKGKNTYSSRKAGEKQAEPEDLPFPEDQIKPVPPGYMSRESKKAKK
jgi:hypothetical protein